MKGLLKGHSHRTVAMKRITERALTPDCRNERITERALTPDYRNERITERALTPDCRNEKDY